MKTTKISILHYAGPPVIGGVESTILHHSILLNQAGFEVQIISGRGEKFHTDIDFHHLPLVDSLNPDVLSVGEELAKGIIPAGFEAIVRSLRNDLEKLIDPGTVIIAHNIITLHKNLALTAALWNMAAAGHSLIAWCHDFAWQDRLYLPDLHTGYPWALLAEPWKNTRYVVVSQDRQIHLSRLIGLPVEAIRVINPGIDYLNFLGVSPQTEQILNYFRLMDARPLILLPARITRRKNIEFAIEMMAYLKADFPNAHLIISGPPGPHNPTNIDYFQNLTAIRNKLLLETSVTFLFTYGNQKTPYILTDQIIAELFRVADVLFFPSKSEGFGIPMLEAGITRLPVFASDIPTFQESSGGYANIFHLKDSPKSAAGMIREFLRNDSAYNLRKRVLEQFTWDAIFRNQIKPLIIEMSNA